jgi:cytochrome b subunit of formate dehydrogenase
VTERTSGQGRERGVGGKSAHAYSWLAGSVCALSLLVLAASLLLILLGSSSPLPRGVTPWRDQAVALVGIVGAPILGGLIASRRPRNAYGWVWLAFGLGLSFQLLAGVYASYALVEPGSLVAQKTIPHLLNPGGPLALTLGSFLLLLFPTGRLPSPQWRFVAWITAVSGAVLMSLSFFYLSPDKAGGAISIVTVVVASALFISVFLSALSLVVRYRRASGVESQQLRWLAGAAALVGVYIVGGLLGLDRRLGEGLWNLFNAATNAGLYAAVGVAILRYRLYEIDIINRTLVYVPLMATLALIYVGGVVGLQATFRTLTGQESTLAVVASTLAIAALFSPLRRRVQALVDRRFYRRKYDAAKTLKAFGSRLREETDLDALRDDLVGVARRTMQPSHVSLWLRPDPELEARSAAFRQFGHAE